MDRGVTAEIDLRAIAFNVNAVKRLTAGLPLIAVVKADAYGHGAVTISRAFEKSGASALAVAFVGEALELRDGGIKAPILVLFDSSDIKSFFDLNLIPVIHDLKTAKAFSKEARKRGVVLNIHIKADTGMGRMGFGSVREIIKAAELGNIRVSGLMSHFSEADLSDKDYSLEQLRRFCEIRDTLIKKGLRPLCHIANSAAIAGMPESHLDAVRPGLMLYLRGATAAMKVYTTVLTLRRLKKGQPVSYGRTFITTRETLEAVLAVGYADGYSRAFSNNACVILKGKRAPVMGRVCMDLIAVDVTDIKGIKAGDKAVLLGREGKETITAWELGLWASTIPYEIFTSLGSRAKKVYRGQ